jgi:hypothetical protein
VNKLTVVLVLLVRLFVTDSLCPAASERSLLVQRYASALGRAGEFDDNTVLGVQRTQRLVKRLKQLQREMKDADVEEITIEQILGLASFFAEEEAINLYSGKVSIEKKDLISYCSGKATLREFVDFLKHRDSTEIASSGTIKAMVSFIQAFVCCFEEGC